MAKLRRFINAMAGPIKLRMRRLPTFCCCACSIKCCYRARQRGALDVIREKPIGFCKLTLWQSALISTDDLPVLLLGLAEETTLLPRASPPSSDCALES